MAQREISSELVGESFAPVDISWGGFDTQLYALAVGADPSGDELKYVYENKGPKVLPTFPVVKVLDIMGVAVSNIKMNLANILHGEQSFTLHRVLPSKFTGQATASISQVWDKGKAAVLGVTGEIADSDGPLVTLDATLFIRGAGGFGGERGPASESEQQQRPERDADFVAEYSTQANQAALYRLTGDRNPIHIDPQFAQFGGFDKPFLHGLCTYGIAGRHIVATLLDGDESRFVSMSGRFASQVWMGDQVITKVWRLGETQALVEVENQKGEVVLNQCLVTFKAAKV